MAAGRPFLIWGSVFLVGLRLVHGAGLFAWLQQSRGYVTSSLDEFLHLGRAWRLSLGPLFALPEMGWQPPGQTLLLASAMRLWPDPYPAAALVSFLGSVVPVLASSAVAWRLFGGRRDAFLVAGVVASCAGALNLVGLVPAMPHGLLAACYAAALWAGIEAAANPSLRSLLVAALCLALVPLARWEGIALVFPLAGVVFFRAILHGRASRSKAWLVLLGVPLPFLWMLWTAGLESIVGRSELLVRDTPPHDAVTMAKLGPLSSLYYLGFVSPVLLLVGLLGVAVAIKRFTREGCDRWSWAAAFAGLGSVLGFYGYLFTRQASGAAPERLSGVIAVAFLPFATLGFLFGARALARVVPWRPVAGLLLLALGVGAAAAEQGRLGRTLRARYAESFAVSQIAKRCQVDVQVERDGETYFGMVPGMVSVLMARNEAPKILPDDRDQAEAAAQTLAVGDAVLFVSPDAVRAALSSDFPGTRLVLSQERRLGPVTWALVLPGDEACWGDAGGKVIREVLPPAHWAYPGKFNDPGVGDSTAESL